MKQEVRHMTVKISYFERNALKGRSALLRRDHFFKNLSKLIYLSDISKREQHNTRRPENIQINTDNRTGRHRRLRTQNLTNKDNNQYNNTELY